MVVRLKNSMDIFSCRLCAGRLYGDSWTNVQVYIGLSDSITRGHGWRTLRVGTLLQTKKDYNICSPLSLANKEIACNHIFISAHSLIFPLHILSRSLRLTSVWSPVNRNKWKEFTSTIFIVVKCNQEQIDKRLNIRGSFIFCLSTFW